MLTNKLFLLFVVIQVWKSQGLNDSFHQLVSYLNVEIYDLWQDSRICHDSRHVDGPTRKMADFSLAICRIVGPRFLSMSMAQRTPYITIADGPQVVETISSTLSKASLMRRSRWNSIFSVHNSPWNCSVQESSSKPDLASKCLDRHDDFLEHFSKRAKTNWKNLQVSDCNLCSRLSNYYSEVVEANLFRCWSSDERTSHLGRSRQ
jgi:hypothetical protein